MNVFHLIALGHTSLPKGMSGVPLEPQSVPILDAERGVGSMVPGVGAQGIYAAPAQPMSFAPTLKLPWLLLGGALLAWAFWPSTDK